MGLFHFVILNHLQIQVKYEYSYKRCRPQANYVDDSNLTEQKANDLVQNILYYRRVSRGKASFFSNFDFDAIM